MLADAKLQGLILTDCQLDHVHRCNAWLERTRLDRTQLGGAVGEELSGEYELARKSYLTLERNFGELGDPDAASWAYRKRRRMEKRAARRVRGRRGSEASERRPGVTMPSIGPTSSSNGCATMARACRVLGSLVALYLVFALLYGVTGSVVRVKQTAAGEVRIPPRTRWTLPSSV